MIYDFIKCVLQENEHENNDVIHILKKWRDKFQQELAQRFLVVSYKKERYVMDIHINSETNYPALYLRITAGNMFVAGYISNNVLPPSMLYYIHKSLYIQSGMHAVSLQVFDALIQVADTLDEFEQLVLQTSEQNNI